MRLIVACAWMLVPLASLRGAEQPADDPTQHDNEVGEVVEATELPAVLQPPEGSVQPYIYECLIESSLATLDDVLAYRTHLIWELALVAQVSQPDRVELDVAITRIRMQLTGPGTDMVLDTNEAADAGLLLEPYRAYLDASLRLVVDPTTGEVTEVSGHDAVVAALISASPGRRPGAASPVAEAARAALTPDALARIWSTLLAVPGSQSGPLPLPPPLSGQVNRSWQGDSYALSLTAAEDAPEIRLQEEPVPVVLTLGSLSGSGTQAFADGHIELSQGELAVTLAGQALTQSVTVSQTLRWQLARLRLGQPPPSLDDDAAEATPVPRDE